jgi:hypothetical protein
MATEYTSGYCRRCAVPSKLERKGTNHVLHLLLSIVTLGLWLIVWIGVAVKFGGWSCSQCGSEDVTTSVPRNATALPPVPPGVSPLTHVRCPDCREFVLAEARKCKHCGTALIPQKL